MANDPEQQLYKDMDDLTEKVPKLRNEVKSLKRRLTIMSKRVESLELMAFQDQISKLDEKVNSIGAVLINTNRSLARFEMDFMQYHVCRAIRSSLKSPERDKLLDHISMEFARGTESIKHSSNPLSISTKFTKECVEYSDKYNLDAWRG